MKRNIIYTGFLFFTLSLLGITSIQAQETNKDSLVNVAFGTVAKEDLLGAVSTVNVADILEKDYYIYSLEGLQSHIGGYTGNIWGEGALILVDGFPRSTWRVNASQIESVTILKGASAVALYGSKAAKGAILITTKRGKEQPLTIDVRANTGWYVPKRYPSYLNSVEYMTLYNETCRNDGSPERYSQSDMYNTAAGTNPFRYPDINFYSSDYLKKAYNQSEVTGEVTGGNNFARYYSNFGIVFSDHIVKYGKQKDNNYMRFDIRSNVDMNLSNWLTASADAAVIIYDNFNGNGNFFGEAATLRPNQFSPWVPVDMVDSNNKALQTIIQNSGHVVDGKYLFGGLSNNQTNTFSDMLAGGYSKDRNRTFQFNVSVGADLVSIVKGLSFKTAFAVDYTDYYTEVWNETYATYEPKWAAVNGKDMIVDLVKYNEDKPSTKEVVGTTFYSQTMTFSAQLNYKRTFQNFHNVSGALVGWGYQQQDSRDSDHKDGASSYHRISNANLGLQAAYNYRQRYYLDFSGAMIHSAKLPKKNRQAFSPTATIGWRISDENFFKEKLSFVDNLKLTVSYANLHQDIDFSDFYMYKGYYTSPTGWYTWKDGTQGGGALTLAKRGDNPNLKLIEQKEFRIGLEAALLDRMIELDVNYFNKSTDGLLTDGSNTTFPSYYSGFNPLINFNKDKRMGVDFTVNMNKKIGQVNVRLGLAGMIYSSEAIRRDETFEEDYQYREGKALDASWGYVCDGFFQDQAEIDAHALQTFGTVKSGDLKYRDINGDGLIDTKDQIDLGHGGNPFIYGLNLTLKWKNFTFFARGTGQAGGIGFKNSSYYWVRGDNKYSDVVWGRWTEETKHTATYPRLTATSNNNNFRNSTFWRFNNNRFNLDKVQITYDLPKELFQNTFIKDVSVYASGQDLLVLSKERKHMETTIGGAAQNRFYNLGFKASF